MTSPAVFWPATLGVVFLVAGMLTYRAERGWLALGPVFVASALAAFAGEHFTAAASLATLVPKFLPGRLFIAYFVGVAHLAAALSYVARRYVRLSSIGLAAMFGLFVLLMDLPAAVTRPGVHIVWVLVAREATFAIGALTLFGLVSGESATIARFARIWTACVLVFYGIMNIAYPQFSPGVPDMSPTAAWVPAPHAIAYVVGAALVVAGLSMFMQRMAASAAAWTGALMTVLTAALFVPQFFVARDVAGQVNAVNFVFDTLLFSGTVLIVGMAHRLQRPAQPDWVAPRLARSELAV